MPCLKTNAKDASQGERFLWVLLVILHRGSIFFALNKGRMRIPHIFLIWWRTLRTLASMAILQKILELVFPSSCTVCGGWLDLPERWPVCRKCAGLFSYINGSLCRICGTPVSGVPGQRFRCGKCHRKKPPYDMARSIFIYESPVKELIARLKYREDTAVLPVIQWLAATADLSDFAACEVIAPVPLHVERLRERGLNQSLELARSLFPDRREIIIPNLLGKVRTTSVQTALDGLSRRKNLRGSFSIRLPMQVLNKRVCLVDDVFTTGTTAAECARVLKQNGAREVLVITLARSVLHKP